MQQQGPANVALAPAASVAVFLVCLPTWAITTILARNATSGIFDDWGIQLDSIDRLKVAVDVTVGLLVPLALLLLGANVALELRRPSLGYSHSASRLLWVNWAFMVALSLVMAGMFAWLLDIRGAQDAAGGGGDTPPWGPWPPATASEEPAPAAAAPLTPGVAQAGALGAAGLALARQPWRLHDAGACPPGCMDLGPIAKAMGLPWPCLCQGPLLQDLTKKLASAVAALVPAFLASLAMMCAASVLCLHVAAEAARAEGAAGALRLEAVDAGVAVAEAAGDERGGAVTVGAAGGAAGRAAE